MVSLGTVSGSLNIFQRMLGIYKPIGCRDDILNSIFGNCRNSPQVPRVLKHGLWVLIEHNNKYISANYCIFSLILICIYMLEKV